MKTCSECGKSKVLDDFYKRSKTSHFGTCKVCVLEQRRQRYMKDGDVLKARVKRYQAENPDLVKAAQKKWRAANADKTRAWSRRTYLLRTYGLTPDDYDQMFAAQGERCAICSTDDPGKTWTIDHDHLTGAVRGILCWHCNVGMGHFRDDAHNLIAAADYILRSVQAEEKAG